MNPWEKLKRHDATTAHPRLPSPVAARAAICFPDWRSRNNSSNAAAQVTLLVSPKEVDQQAVKMARDVEIVTLPAVGLQNRNYFSFGRSFLKSWLAARKVFRQRKPAAALAMGGFTSAPPIFAAKQLGAKTFLHESNTIPGTGESLAFAFCGSMLCRISAGRRETAHAQCR